jgi:hypothetical protein
MGTVVRLLPVVPVKFPGGITEAVAWYAVGIRVELLASVTAPPVDDTGNEFVDAVLAAVFVKLTRTPWASSRIGYLNDLAEQNDRAAAACRLTKQDSECIASVVRAWATAFHEVATAEPMGAA